jgi:Flp pilus assembly protein TadG
MTRPAQKDRSTRGRGDDGAALVEFALVCIILFTLVFGIIHFGYLLSFKQDMTRAAAEGARAGAVAFPASNALDDAEDATQDAVEAAGKDCGGNYSGLSDPDGDGMTCTVTVGPCVTASGDCVTVLLSYDQEDHPVLGAAPFVGLILPDTLTSKSEARVNPS